MWLLRVNCVRWTIWLQVPASKRCVHSGLKRFDKMLQSISTATCYMTRETSDIKWQCFWLYSAFSEPQGGEASFSWEQASKGLSRMAVPTLNRHVGFLVAQLIGIIGLVFAGEMLRARCVWVKWGNGSSQSIVHDPNRVSNFAWLCQSQWSFQFQRSNSKQM